MNERNDRDEVMLGRLLRASGRGPAPSAEARERIYRAVQAEWRHELAERDGRSGRSNVTAFPGPAGRAGSRTRRNAVLALAASLGAVVIGLQLMRAPTPVAAADFGSIAKLTGTVTIASADGSREVTATDSGIAVSVGDVLRVAPGAGLGMRLASGATLALDAGSELLVSADDSVHLRNGSVYFDSNEIGNVELSVETAFGSVRHTGTQYEARVGNADLRVRVREGAIAFSDDGRRFAAEAGEELSITISGAPARTEIASTDPAWGWVESLVTLTADAGDDRDVIGVLGWIARQTGRELSFENAGTEQAAREITVSGLGGLTPEEALEAMNDTTSLRLELSDRRLDVSGR